MSGRYTGHGSMAAHKRHLAAGEGDCQECAAYMAAWRDAHGWGPLDLRPCGTPAALRRHERRKEPIDAACRKTRVRIHEDYEQVRAPRDRSRERRRRSERRAAA